MLVPGLPTSGMRKKRMTGPKLIPKGRLKSRSVYLDPEMWDQLTEIADFHSAVLEQATEKKAGEKDVEVPTFSRNDVIAAFLDWAKEAYWEDRGGKPTTERDRHDKIRRAAEALKKEK